MPAGSLYRQDGVESGAASFDCGQSPIDHGRCRPLPGFLHAAVQLAFQSVAIGGELLEVRITCVRFGGEVEEVERPA